MEQPKTLKGILIVPIGLACALVPFSIVIGWNLITLLLFWFVAIPLLTLFLPKIVSRNGNQMFESLAGLLIFYAIMVFMIYDFYKTDYFQLMIGSCIVNVVLVMLLGSLRKSQKRTT